jgi:hypothetical protein
MAQQHFVCSDCRDQPAVMVFHKDSAGVNRQPVIML